MVQEPISLILAEDDADDRLLFEEAINELSIRTKLTSVHDGEELMHLLAQANDSLAHALFLDVNMPRKNGFKCLAEIRSNKTLTSLPVIIFSTSFDKEVVSRFYDRGANYYMRKPTGFLRLKDILERTLILILTTGLVQPPKDKFVINAL